MTSFAQQTLHKFANNFFAHLRKACKITDKGTLDRFIGVQFERSRDKRSRKAKLVGTPMDPGFVFTPKDLGEERTEESESLYRTLIRSIEFIAAAVRFDI